jgi:sporulation protein YunB
MRKVKGKSHLKRKPTVLFRIIISLVIIIFIMFLIDLYLSPSIKQVSEKQASIYANQIINSAIYDELSNNNIDYSEFTKNKYDNNGNVSSIEANSMLINIFKTKVTERIVDNMNLLTDREIRIPLGNLLNSYILSGRGPKVPFRIIFSGKVNVDLESHFESTAINQSKHQIIMTVETNISTVLAWHSIDIIIPNIYYLADTVVVGDIPGTFAEASIDNGDKLYPPKP